MILKNNNPGNIQLNYPVVKNKNPDVEYIHIPGGATVEIDDAVFKKLCEGQTRVEIHEEVITTVEDTDVMMGKEKVVIKDYFPTGKFKTINLLEQRIKDGEFTIMVDVVVSEAEMDKFLNSKGVSVKDMDLETKTSMYNKLK